MRRKVAPALLMTCAVGLLFIAPASADVSYQSSFGFFGSEGGGLSRPAGMGINQATGDLYVADYENNRVDEFTEGGNFVRAWGYNVVASGEHDKPFADEVDEIQIRSGSGYFRLSFENESTSVLPHDAPAAEVEEELNELPTISSGGGSVAVTGGPGDLAGTSPYVVTFNGGPLAERNLSLRIDTSALPPPPGAQFSCHGETPEFSFGAKSFSYSWLADGVPVGEGQTFTPGAGEEGKAIQCQVSGHYYSGGPETILNTSRPYTMGPGTVTTLPPVGPEKVELTAAPSGALKIGGQPGGVLTCKAGTWQESPAEYTYRWYLNGQEISSPDTTAATSDTHVLTSDDLTVQGVFQCSVTGTNGEHATTAFSTFLETNPGPRLFSYNEPAARVSVDGPHSSRVITRTNGGPVFEVCQAETSDECQAGTPGPSFGQLSSPRSIAVDNSPGGNGAVYVQDESNFRVQKFAPDGTPILEFGKGVDQTSGGDVCEASSGHACGAGRKAVDESPVAMGSNNGSTFGVLKDLGNELAVGPDGEVYVAEGRVDIESDPENGCPREACWARMQKFDSSGNYLGMTSLPRTQGGIGAPISYRPVSVAVDSNGVVYETSSRGLLRIHADAFGQNGGTAPLGGNLFLTNNLPMEVAVDPRNDRILVTDLNERESSQLVSACGGPMVNGRAILELDTQMRIIDCSIPTGSGNLTKVSGLGVNENGRLFASLPDKHVVKVFDLPPFTAPTVGVESAALITTQSADLHADVNPGFEATSYAFEYGLGDCEVTTCTTIDGTEAVNGVGFHDVAVKISGLEPNTQYHFRVIAENPLGTDVGTDKTFKTFPLIDLVNDPCSNALARKQTGTAGLLDCRAYELVSAPFTGGYDVVSNLVPGQQPFEGYPDAANKVLYGVKDGGIPGTGNPTNRGIDPYVAERGENGWATRYVGIPSDNPYAVGPFSSNLVGASDDLATLAFGGESICKPCFADGSSGIPVRLPDGSLVQGATGSEPDPSADRAGYVAQPLSADGTSLVFGTTSAIEPTATAGDETLYERLLSSEAAEVISTLPDGSTMTGDVGELALSADGSRAVVAEKVGTDGAGHPLWHPYLHIRGSSHSIDLTGGPTSGVQFSGMTPDGSTVFLRTIDHLPVDQPFSDEDESIDLYRARVDEEGSLNLELISVNSDGSVSNNDACLPPGDLPWNSQDKEDVKCHAVAFSGGAGVAKDGTFFFVSPEQLEAGKGVANQANLYVVAPEGSPHPKFVATIDNALEKAGPAPPEYPLISNRFAGQRFHYTGQLTVDQSSQDLYLVETALGKIQRFHVNGTPANFTAGPGAGTNQMSGFEFSFGPGNQPAVDNSPASQSTPLQDALYVPDGSTVKLFAPSGEQIGALDGSGNASGNFGSFGGPCGVAIDQLTGAAYIADSAGKIWQYTPASPTGSISDADYTVKGIEAEGVPAPCGIAADTQGNVYAAGSESFYTPAKPVHLYSATSFATGPPPAVAGTDIGVSGTEMATDPQTDELYVDTGSEIKVFDVGGNELANFGAGQLNCAGPIASFPFRSHGVAVDGANRHAFASCMEEYFNEGLGSIREWGYSRPTYEPINNPAVIHGVTQPESHSWADFQTSSDSGYAIFATVAALTNGYDNGGRFEVYRYNISDGGLVCVSCNSTEARAHEDSTLPRDGLGVLPDGRVFFNSGEGLTLNDTNGKPDAYEWSPQRSAPGGCKLSEGCQQLISTGTSADPSGLLSVSSDGKDAYFFTRQVIVPEDKNGLTMKIYDAREGGGVFVVPPPPPCAASDECHGPGTRAQDPPQVGSFKGSGGQFEPPSKACKKGFRRRKGHCVRRKRTQRSRRAGKSHRRNARRGGTH